MIKIHPVFFFFNPYFKIPFSQIRLFWVLSGWRSSVQTPPMIVDWQDHLTLDPPWVNWELSAIVSTPVQGKTRCLRLSDWGVLLLGVIMNIAVVIYSWHVSRWRRSGLRLFLKGMRPLICLNASMFVQIIRDLASPTAEVSLRVFNEPFQIAFPNNVLISKFHDECG